MKKPNFFILGEPKSGTTSLAEWLRAHPNVFMTDPKEPWFFNHDVGFSRVTTWPEYEALYRDAKEQHVAVGEASTSYLWSREAVPAILEYAPNARFIVMLRFPPEMAISLHAQDFAAGSETQSFAEAWALQRQRAKGQALPRFARHADMFQYGEKCQIGHHLSWLFEHVSRERVLVLFLEDVIADVEEQWSRVIEFLDIPPYRPASFPVKNERRYVRNMGVMRLFSGLSYIKQKLGVKRSFGVMRQVRTLNTAKSSRKTKLADLPRQLQGELAEYFANEIELVEASLGQVPHSWHEKFAKLRASTGDAEP